MAIKTKFSPATIEHFIIGLMIFLWSWASYNLLTALIVVTVVAILKEVFDYFFKLKLLKYLISSGFYDGSTGLWLEKNKFIMSRFDVVKAVPLFDFKDIVATCLVPYAIGAVYYLIQLF